MDSKLRKTLIREYYFAEALALYERFYLPLVSPYAPARTELADVGRQADRPPTWEPLVFHCTTVDHMGKIFDEECLKPSERGAVSFTEIPIGELDRMKYRHHEKEQVAIGFPRKYIESLGLTPVWYLKHNPEIRHVLGMMKEQNPAWYDKISAFIDNNDDVSPFQEIRTTSHVDMAEAVWILTTKRSGTPSVPEVPQLERFESKNGHIPKSYWHRSHQMGVLSEWQFVQVEKAAHDGVPTSFRSIGEHYWSQQVTKEKELKVTFPVHHKDIIFEMMDKEQRKAYEGPFRFIDVAQYVAKILCDCGEDLSDLLPYRLLSDLTGS
jgi:hypothetical protein